MRFGESGCRRARELSSLELDEELSQLEQTQLAVHVRSCASCRDFRRGVRGATEALRSAALESPGRQVMLPHRRRMPLRAMQVGAAALVVATGFGAFIPLHSHLRRSIHATVLPGNSEQTELTVFRNVRLDRIKPMPVGLAGGAQ